MNLPTESGPAAGQGVMIRRRAATVTAWAMIPVAAFHAH